MPDQLRIRAKRWLGVMPWRWLTLGCVVVIVATPQCVVWSHVHNRTDRPIQVRVHTTQRLASLSLSIEASEHRWVPMMRPFTSDELLATIGPGASGSIVCGYHLVLATDTYEIVVEREGVEGTLKCSSESSMAAPWAFFGGCPLGE